MTDFATILSKLEEASLDSDRPKRVDFAALIGALANEDARPAPSETPDRAARAAVAYGAAVGASTAPPELEKKDERPLPRLPDREETLRELRRAEGSIDELHALRRRIAWACHPDRREKSSARQAERLLAEFNAQIDSAITRAKTARARRAATEAADARRRAAIRRAAEFVRG
jgi:hypothetical protein